MRVDPELKPTLVERARRLARPIADEETTSASGGLLRFVVGSEALALATDSVVEVQAATRPAPLPGMPAWLAGMVGIHGRILPAVWLDRFLSGGSGADSDHVAKRAIVLRAEDGAIVLLATAVEGIVPALGSKPYPLPEGMAPVALECALGIQRGDLVIDATRLVRAIGVALGSSTTGLRQSPLEINQGEQSHAYRT